MPLFSTTRRINLALQGGGAHGAFTWGVLDRLLEESTIELGWVSGTSAGAINAVALAGGLAAGSRQQAREVLRAVWAAVEAAGMPDFVRLNPFLYGMSKASSLNIGAYLSPYEFNPLGFDPLAKLLEAHIDFTAIRSKPGIELLIAATDAGSGLPRLFRRGELTVEAVLASACLPQIHHAVEIGGRAYWDGGYSANPDVLTLATESPVADTLIVQLNPLDRATHPRTARDIAGQIGIITFSQPLLRDIGAIVTAQDELGRRWFGAGGGRLARIARHRFHVVEAGRYTSGLAADSKMTPERGLFAYLFDAGRTEMARWLERHRGDIGKRQSVNLRQRYLERPRERLGAAEAAPGPGAGPEDGSPGAALAEATSNRI